MGVALAVTTFDELCIGNASLPMETVLELQCRSKVC